jgi:hypothetical protein
MPIHKQRTPVKPIEISNAVFEVSKVVLISSGNTLVSPIKNSLTLATKNAIIKNAIQM